MAGAHIFDTLAITWTEEARFPGIAFKILESRATHPAISMVLGRVDAGRIIETHTHLVETETAYVLSGRGLLKVGDEEMLLTAGMGVTIPPGLPHSLRNAGDAPLEVIAMHSPPTR